MLTETQEMDARGIAHMLEQVDPKYLPMVATGVSMLLAREQMEKDNKESA